MTEKCIQIIKSILTTADIKPKMVFIELFDQIFQKNHDEFTRKKLFIELVNIYDLWILPDEFPKHLCTGVLDKSQEVPIDTDLMHNYIRRLRAIKAYFPEEPEKASADVFKLIEEQTAQRFNFFYVLFLSGYFPYQSDNWILFEHPEPEEQDDETVGANKLMLRICWALQENDQLLQNYTLNLIRSLSENPAAQKAVLVHFMFFMKHQGKVEFQNSVKMTSYEVTIPSLWGDLIVEKNKPWN